MTKFQNAIKQKYIIRKQNIVMQHSENIIDHFTPYRILLNSSSFSSR